LRLVVASAVIVAIFVGLSLAVRGGSWAHPPWARRHAALEPDAAQVPHLAAQASARAAKIDQCETSWRNRAVRRDTHEAFLRACVRRG
jgi:hypothetical protein